MPRTAVFPLISVWIFLSSVPLRASVDPVQILRDTDRARGQIGEGISWKVKLSSEENGNRSEREFTVKALGDNARVDALAPPRDRGQIFLFNDRNMWFFKPGLGRPVSISSRQRLTGQAANGDIASTNFVRDYSPTLERNDKIGSQNVWVLMLKAKSSQVTYDQIRYFVDQKTRLAVRAEFLTADGELFKRGHLKYDNSLMLKGKRIPFVSEFRIEDAQDKNNWSLLKYSQPRPEKLSPGLFNVNQLSR